MGRYKVFLSASIASLFYVGLTAAAQSVSQGPYPADGVAHVRCNARVYTGSAGSALSEAYTYYRWIYVTAGKPAYVTKACEREALRQNDLSIVPGSVTGMVTKYCAGMNEVECGRKQDAE